MYICKNNSDYLQNIINSIKSFIKQKKNVESPKGKILIVGESSVSIRHIEKSIKELGFALERFEFILGYDEIKKFSFDKIFNNPDYAVILASAMPHITINSNGYSSTISSKYILC